MKPSLSPKILVVLNGKGGVGKTTTAINLSATFAEQNPVLLVDADPQGSAAWWVGQSQQGMGFDLAQATNPEQLQALRQIQNYSVIVLDTPPALGSQTLATVVPIADYLILPTPPSPMDLSVMIETVRTQVTPTGIPHRVLLTRVDPRSLGDAVEARSTLIELGIPVCNTFIRAYKAHERAALEGMSIAQWRGSHARDAEADYRQVAAEIQQDWRKSWPGNA